MVYLMTGKTISNHLGLQLCKVCGGKGSLTKLMNKLMTEVFVEQPAPGFARVSQSVSGPL